MLTLTQRLNASELNPTPNYELPLTAEERQRSRYRFSSPSGQEMVLDLPRGTTLQHGDILQAETGEYVVVLAKPELVLTVEADTPLALLKATYHLGNRHVPLEINPSYLRLAPDPVLQHLLEHLGLRVREEIAPFSPESGAYGHSHH
ncbi:urease accessory protein UreE [Spirulina subsalsa FACHB-351]|uniref:Urease accessory protein UreE n=1 Tax=Spirulina subsalsa FACHB-351 TaxID=234711 RepID=A0ABT3L2B3_9CYAN|nr:urease accessory protein UreE [Spirulina subsalsa]MCW6035646.1 urease accessory protein UreE [Spirulina subsalsa FACHB-351]